MVDIYSIRDKTKEYLGKVIGDHLAVAATWAQKRKRNIALSVAGLLAAKLVIPPLVVPSYYMTVYRSYAERAGEALHKIPWEKREFYKQPMIWPMDESRWMFVDNAEDDQTYADKKGNPITRRCLYLYSVEAVLEKGHPRQPPSIYYPGIIKAVRWPLIATECRVGDTSFYEYYPR